MAKGEKSVEANPVAEKSEILVSIAEFSINSGIRNEVLKGFEVFAKEKLGKLYSTPQGWSELFASYTSRQIL